MEPFLQIMDANPGLVMGAFVFLAVSTASFGVMAAVRVRGDVRRRAADISATGPRRATDDRRSLRHASTKAAQRLIDYTTRN
jgi:tight adherence protein C